MTLVGKKVFNVSFFANDIKIKQQLYGNILSNLTDFIVEVYENLLFLLFMTL